jgi:hypothetical protein
MQRAARRIRGSGGASIRSVVTRAGNRTCSEQLVTSAALLSAVHVYPESQSVVHPGPGISQVGIGHASVMRCRRSPRLAGGRCCGCHRRCQLSSMAPGGFPGWSPAFHRARRPTKHISHPASALWPASPPYGRDRGRFAGRT